MWFWQQNRILQGVFIIYGYIKRYLSCVWKEVQESVSEPDDHGHTDNIRRRTLWEGRLPECSTGPDPWCGECQDTGYILLPNGTGKDQTVVVFAKGAKAQEAKDAGADVVGDDDLVARIQDGWLDFDVAIATPDMMAQVGRLGRVLGPKGLMPNPKTGTVTMDVTKAVTDAKSGQVTYRTDRDGNVHVPLGKVSFTEEALEGNFKAVYDVIAKARPASVKGVYIKHVSVASTFGPSVTLDTTAL